MQKQRGLRLSDRQAKLRAWLVHGYTALGLPCAFLALLAAYQGDAQQVFLILLLALAIDGTDGPLARRFDVKKWTPHFDGRKLDDIIDYMTYTFIPVFFMWRFEVVTGQWAIVLLVTLVCSAYGFCSDGAKTPDKYFTGFPSYWNVVALFLYVLGLPMLANAAIILFLALLTLTPVRFASSQAVKPFERVFMLLAGVLALALVLNLQNPPALLIYAALAYPMYHLVSSIIFFIRDELKEGAAA
jgi:phosphatidylcholine synthase